MLQNEYLVAKFGFDTAKNERQQVLQCLAKNLEFNAVERDRIRQLRSPEEYAADGLRSVPKDRSGRAFAHGATTSRQ